MRQVSPSGVGGKAEANKSEPAGKPSKEIDRRQGSPSTSGMTSQGRSRDRRKAPVHN